MNRVYQLRLRLLITIIIFGLSVTAPSLPPVAAHTMLGSVGEQQGITPSSQPLNCPPTKSSTSSYDTYGGWCQVPINNNSGYFRTAQVGNNKWLVTPQGHGFFSAGMNYVSYGKSSLTTPTVYTNVFETYDQRAFDKYHSAATWANASATQLQGWNFNTIGAFSGPDIRHHGLAETRFLSIGATSAFTSCFSLSRSQAKPVEVLNGQGDYAALDASTASQPCVPLDYTPVRNVKTIEGTDYSGFFPDVFSPAFADAAAVIAGQLITSDDISDPWLIGYYTDNELLWYYSEKWVDAPDNTLVEEFIKLGPTEPGKIAWKDLLYNDYHTHIGELNVAWGTNYGGFDDLLNVNTITTPAARVNKSHFLAQIADHYYSITSSAIHQIDPNHLILGDRYINKPLYQEVVTAAGNYADVISLNLYNVFADNLEMENLDEIARWTTKPIMITEFGSHAADSGMPAYAGSLPAVLPTQRDNASVYELTMSEALRRPYVVGAHWFKYSDSSVLMRLNDDGSKIYDGRSNWGFVDINDTPYTDLTSLAALYNADLYYRKLGQPAVNLEPPIPLRPDYGATLVYPPNAYNPTPIIYGAPLLANILGFGWRAVNGASTYTLQVSRYPNNFGGARTYTTAATVYTPTDTFTAGRWYWRVKANNGSSDAVSDAIAYTAPQPFEVLGQSRTLSLSDFEAPEEELLSPTPGARWQAVVPGHLSLAASLIGATSPIVAALMTFSGQIDGGVPGYNWAFMQRVPTYIQPTDWRGYDYLSIDVTNQWGDNPAPFFGFVFTDLASPQKWYGTFRPVRNGTDTVTLDLSAAQAEGLDLSRIGSLSIGTRRPLPGSQLAIDTLTLHQVAHDNITQPVVNPIVTDAAASGAEVSGTLTVDWSSYQPVTSTVAYYLYVSPNPTIPSNPTMIVDATAQRTQLRTWYDPTTSGHDPNGSNLLSNGISYYVWVVAADRWGHRSQPGSLVSSQPTECSAAYTYTDVAPNYWAYVFVNHLSCLHIVSGTGGGLFSPHAITSRAQFTKMLTLALGWPLVNNPQYYTDVPPSNRLYTYVQTVTAHGLMNDYSPGDCAINLATYPCFLPNKAISRLQVAYNLVHAYGWAIDTSGGPHFSDVGINDTGYAEVETCYHRGVVSGVGGGKFDPTGNVSRDQMSKFLYLSVRQP